MMLDVDPADVGPIDVCVQRQHRIQDPTRRSDP